MLALVIRAAVLLSLAGAILLLEESPNAQAHHDPPGAPEVYDWIEVRGLGLIQPIESGDAEICIDIRYLHPNHQVNGVDADWIKFDCWEKVNDDAASDANPVWIIGKDKGRSFWQSPTHTECVSTAAWEWRARVTEIDGNTGPVIANAAAELAKEAGKRRDPKGVIGGALAEALSAILTEIFGAGGHFNVGAASANWGDGEGDVNREITRTDTKTLFKYEVTKVDNAVQPQKVPNPCGEFIMTPPPTPSPPPQSPSIPPDDGCGGYDHPFFPSRASQVWSSWHGLGGLIDTIGPEVGEPGSSGFDVVTSRGGLRKLILGIGSAAAAVEVTEAQSTPGVVPPAVLAQALDDLTLADGLKASAISNSSTNDLHAALFKYQEVFDALVPHLHSGCVAAASVGGIAGLVGPDAPAERGSGSGNGRAPIAAAAAVAAAAVLVVSAAVYMRLRRMRRA